MRVEAPVFAFDSQQAKPLPKSDKNQNFSRVLNERVTTAHHDSPAQAGATDSAADAEIEEPNQDTELSESVEDQQNQEAQTDAGGDQPADEHTGEAFDLVDELTLEALDDAWVEAPDELPVDDLTIQDNQTPEEGAVFASVPVAIPLEAMSKEGVPTTEKSPVVSGWAQAFDAQPLDAQPMEQQAVVSEAVQADSEDPLQINLMKTDAPDGAIKVPEGMTPVRLELTTPLDLTKPQAPERLQEAIEFQIRASKGPNGAKQLSLTLNPEGLGRLRILAQSDGDKMRITLKVEQGDAARLIERVIPQLEAQIAASVALPVEFELIQDERLSQDAAEQFGDFEDDQSTHDQDEQNEDSDLVEQWTKSLEEPVLDLGQTLHVVA